MIVQMVARVAWQELLSAHNCTWPISGTWGIPSAGLPEESGSNSAAQHINKGPRQNVPMNITQLQSVLAAELTLRGPTCSRSATGAHWSGEQPVKTRTRNGDPNCKPCAAEP